jgi:hypothetical protein
VKAITLVGAGVHANMLGRSNWDAPMSSSKFVNKLILIVALLAASSPSFAQNLNGPMTGGPTARPFPASNGYVNPDLLDYDLQVFSPFEITSLDNYVEPHTGLFFTYDRTYLSTSRPGQVGTFDSAFPTGNDFTWGNRYELGYMGENESGFNIKWLGQEGGFFSAGRDPGNSVPFLTRTGIDTVAINRAFRQQLKSGGYIEPYAGVRYFGLTDDTIEDTTFTVGTTVISNRFIQEVNNSTVGGHVGTRYVNRYGRFTNSVDLAVGAGYNSQRYFASDIQFSNDNGTTNIGVGEATTEDNSFTPIIDMSAFSSYNVSRDISVRGGVHLLYCWDGVARANTLTSALNPNSLPTGPLGPILTQDLVAVGFSFGLDFRR